MSLAADECRAILALCLMAAFADGDQHAREREEIRRIAEGFSEADGAALPSLYQDVLLKRIKLGDAVARLDSAVARQLAYEMAVCVCDADGAQSPAERAFLEQLRQSLGLDAQAAAVFTEQAEGLAAAALPVGASVAASAAAPVPPAAVGGKPGDAELDRTILDAAILNGALELLPETLSTLAIIPLQARLVHAIGNAHGYALDSGHIKEFVATVGVGLSSQYLEQAGRKLLGGLFGRIGGGLLGGVGKQAVSSGMSFATTYALGHVAKRYYAGGRQLSTDMLRQAFADVMQDARGLQSRHASAIQDKARTLDPKQLMSLVGGG